MMSRHNNLVSKNKKALHSQLQVLNNGSANPVALAGMGMIEPGSLPKISHQTPNMIAPLPHQHSPSSHAPYSSLKQNTMLNASKSGPATSKPLPQGQKLMSTTMVY